MLRPALIVLVRNEVGVMPEEKIDAKLLISLKVVCNTTHRVNDKTVSDKSVLDDALYGISVRQKILENACKEHTIRLME